MDTEERIARIEEALARAHRTGNETGACLVGIVRVICDALPDRVLRIQRALQTAIDAADQDDKPVIQTLLRACLQATRQQ